MTESIPTWARPGVKVVCVEHDDLDLNGRPKSPTLTAGEIYTIERAYVDADGVWVAVFGLGLDYEIDGFRPLVTRSQEQDTAMFRKLLNTCPEALDA